MRLSMTIFGARHTLKVFFPPERRRKWLPAILWVQAGPPTVVYTKPWLGLTDEDFAEACQMAERGNYLVAFQRIQAKLKEKNT